MKKSLTLVLVLTGILCFAQLRLPALVSSGMVLQQNETTVFHGWGAPGSWVLVETSWNGRKDSVKITNLATWQLPVAAPAAGGPFQIRIRNLNEQIVLSDIWIGEVWLCSGQSNMEWSYYQGLKDIREELPKSFDRQLRLFHIPKTGAHVPQQDVRARWKVCDSVSLKEFSAVGYFFGKRLRQTLMVPVGLINASWGGTPAETWVPESMIRSDAKLSQAADQLKNFDWWPSAPGKAFNGMIAPLTDYAIAGTIWYQGESNVDTYSTYTELMEKLVASWRDKWKKEFPFFYVQIAPYEYGDHYRAALLREAQLSFENYSRTGMIVVTDLVDNLKDIHPVNKHDVGKRLGDMALGKHYRKIQKGFRYPQIKAVKKEKGGLRIEFDQPEDGLRISGDQLKGCFISGADEKWLPADGRVEGNSLLVWNKKLKNPEFVRFGFGNAVPGNLFSGYGLPVIPFRTDNFSLEK